MARNNRNELAASGEGDGEDGTRTIEIEVGEQTARQLEEIAWSFGTSRERLLRTCCVKTVEEAES